MKATFVGGGSHRLLGILRSAMGVRGIFDGGEIRLCDLDGSRAEAMGRMKGMMLAACAAGALALGAPVQAAETPPQRLVFAHFHLPYAPHGASVEGYKRDIRDARRVGLDGFVLNMGAWHGENGHYEKKTAMLFQAAKEADPAFRLFLSPDLSGPLPPAEIVEMVKQYAPHPNYFRYRGRPVLSCWAGEGGGLKARDFWRDGILGPLRAAGLNVFFVPMFYTADYDETPDYAKVRENFVGPITRSREKPPYPAWWPEIVDGMYSFGAAGLPSYGPHSILQAEEAFARVMHEHGKLFMSAINPQYWGAQQGGGRRYYEYQGGEGLAAQWQSILEKQKPEWIECFTWTDFTEASYLSPTTEAERCNWSLRTGWGEGFFKSHAGFAELSRYFIAWYKTGKQPPIREDRLFWFYRTHPKDAVAPHDRRGPVTARIGPVEDTLYLTTLLTKPAELRVNSGGTESRLPVGAGMVHTRVPFRPGEQRFSLWRGGKRIVNATGDPIVEHPSKLNFIETSGFASATPRPELVVTGLGWEPAQPAPGQGVILSAVIKNAGSAPAMNSLPVGFWVDDRPVGEGRLPAKPLAPGASITVSTTVPWTAEKGEHTLLVQVDPEHRLGEASPYNNLKTLTLLVGPALSVLYAAQNEDVNLSSEGSQRWTAWSPAAAGTAISYRVLGAEPASPFAGGPVTFRGAGLTPGDGGLRVSGVGNGFALTVPANASQRTLLLYVGGERSEGTLSARLSDGSAPAFSQPMYESNLSGTYFTVYTITYRAASPGQMLTVEWKVSKGEGSVILQAAALR